MSQSQGHGESLFRERNGSNGGLHRKDFQRRGKNSVISAASTHLNIVSNIQYIVCASILCYFKSHLLFKIRSLNWPNYSFVQSTEYRVHYWDGLGALRRYGNVGVYLNGEGGFELGTRVLYAKPRLLTLLLT